MTDNHRKIRSWLKSGTELPDEAIAGIMGNMEAESNCEPCRLQGDFSAGRERSVAYAAAVDSGEKTAEAFRGDSLGWGLCQWTYFSRKAELLEFCRNRGFGIADLEGQLLFFVYEMQREYPNLWRRLLSCRDVTEATRLVITEYERPAVLNTDQRAAYARQFYEEFHTEGSGDNALTKAITLAEQVLELLRGMEAIQ